MHEEVLEIIKKKWKEIVIVTFGLLLLIFSFIFGRSSDTSEIEWEEWTDSQLSEQTTDTQINDQVGTQTIYIDIKGHVKWPGVYEIESGKRIVDALELSGGVTEEGDSEQLNLALKLTDQMVVYVPHVNEEENTSTPFLAIESTSEGEKVNLNTADLAQLMTLDGIGPKKAEAILLYREEKGSFKTIEELMEVGGIGEKTFENLKEKIETTN